MYKDCLILICKIFFYIINIFCKFFIILCCVSDELKDWKNNEVASLTLFKNIHLTFQINY